MCKCVYVCLCVCVCVCVCMCMCLCLCLCLCVRPFSVKVSSVWISWIAKEQINDVVLKTSLSYAKSLHRYFRMKHLTFLTSEFILFTHQKQAEPRLNECTSHFQNIPLTGIALAPRHIVSKSASGVCNHESGCNLTIED